MCQGRSEFIDVFKKKKKTQETHEIMISHSVNIETEPNDNATVTRHVELFGDNISKCNCGLW